MTTKIDRILCLFAAAAIVGVIFYHFCKSSKQNFTAYSEANEQCRAGAVECRLSTGDLGMCDSKSGRCVWRNTETTSYNEAMAHTSYGAPFPAMYNVQTSNSLYKEIHPNCLEGLQSCNLSDGTTGVCYLGGICSPSTLVAR